MIIEKTETYDVPDQIKFNTSMIKLSLSYYEDAYTLPQETIATTGAADVTAKQTDGRNKEVTFEILMSRCQCIIKYCDNYSKHLDFCDNTTEMSQVMIRYQILNQLISKQKQQEKLLLMVILKLLKKLYH